MTEEDTFLRLKRCSFEDMKALYFTWYGDIDDLRKCSTLLKDNGWMSDDFLAESKREANV